MTVKTYYESEANEQRSRDQQRNIQLLDDCVCHLDYKSNRRIFRKQSTNLTTDSIFLNDNVSDEMHTLALIALQALVANTKILHATVANLSVLLVSGTLLRFSSLIARFLVG